MIDETSYNLKNKRQIYTMYVIKNMQKCQREILMKNNNIQN